MADVVTVAVVKSLSQLGENGTSVGLGKRARRDDTVVKSRFLAQIGNDEKTRIGIKNIVDLEDIRMRR